MFASCFLKMSHLKSHLKWLPFQSLSSNSIQVSFIVIWFQMHLCASGWQICREDGTINPFVTLSYISEFVHSTVLVPPCESPCLIFPWLWIHDVDFLIFSQSLGCDLFFHKHKNDPVMDYWGLWKDPYRIRGELTTQTKRSPPTMELVCRHQNEQYQLLECYVRTSIHSRRQDFG